MGYVDVIKKTALGAESIINRDSGDGEAFDQAMKKARKKAAGHRDMVNGVLDKNKLSGSVDGAYSFRRASQAAETLDLVKSGFPSTYQKQLGVGMMVMGHSGLSSMMAGASLMNCDSSAEALREIFGSLGAARAHLKLDRGALGDLGQVLADSGLGDEEIDAFLSGIDGGGLTVEEIYARLEKLDLKAEGGNNGLTATEGGLSSLGQFLSGLGVSPEAVNSLTSGFMPGDRVAVADLRQILGGSDEQLTAPCLDQASINSLASTLKSMGLGQSDLNGLSNLLARNNGQMSLGDVLNFLEGVENTPAKTLAGDEMKLVKNILDNISREQELVKMPVFDETLVKLRALGDREIDDDFMRLSPALQALRGGVSGSDQNAAFGGQSGHGGQRHGQDGRHDGQEHKEQFQRTLSAAGGDSAPAAASEAVETVQSYGGQESLVRQIAQKIAYSRRRGVHRLKMNLNPVDMGRLEIELKVQGDQLVAHIRAENRETYDALAGEVESLKTALAESGLEISNLTLAFDDRETGRTEFADFKNTVDPAPAADEYFPENAAAYQGSVYRVI